ncbi:MAG: hypothetical protein ACFFDT_31565, partial [Candidatus Hodarchaeota archaeon]
MKSDDLKQELIEYIADIHVGLLFPKKYFGCLWAVFIEKNPITQDRIIELTGYSRTTVSQMLNIIQVIFPLIQIKKPKIRKKYYSINLSTREFMITFLRLLIDAYKDRVDFILPLIEEIKPYTKKHQKFRDFSEFLKNYFEFSTLYINLFSDTTDELNSLIKIG